MRILSALSSAGSHRRTIGTTARRHHRTFLLVRPCGPGRTCLPSASVGRKRTTALECVPRPVIANCNKIMTSAGESVTVKTLNSTSWVPQSRRSRCGVRCCDIRGQSAELRSPKVEPTGVGVSAEHYERAVRLLGPVAACAVLLGGCGQILVANAGGSTSVSAGQADPSGTARQQQTHSGPPHPVATLTPVGTYQPVVGAWTATAPAPADLSGFAPGVRHLLEDYRSKALGRYDFVRLSLMKMGALRGSLPTRYADVSSVPRSQMDALQVSSREAGNQLSADQLAALKALVTAQR